MGNLFPVGFAKKTVLLHMEKKGMEGRGEGLFLGGGGLILSGEKMKK